VRTARVLVASLLMVGLSACGSDDPGSTVASAASDATIEQLRVEVISTTPHDTTAFTEGLEVDGAQVYESTGLEGRSAITRSDLATGAVQARQELAPDLFGEGVTLAGDRLWQLTWKKGTAISRDPQTLAETGRARYDGEGWGLCAQPDRLVMSNGTATLTFRDRTTFAVLGTVDVTAAGTPLTRINELECTRDGQVWANVWQTDQIVRIDPTTGHVTAVVDAAGLLTPAQARSADVLNGIAALPGTDEFLVTGKLWPTTFTVRFVPA
jgi:glutamine cyclotransferase